MGLPSLSRTSLRLRRALAERGFAGTAVVVARAVVRAPGTAALRAPTLANGVRTVRGRTSFRSTAALVDFGRFTCSGLIAPLQDRGEIADLLDLVRARDCRRVLELGTANGGTLFYLSRVVGGDATIVTVDLPYSRFQPEPGLADVDLFHAFALPGQRIVVIKGNSHHDETASQVREAFGDRPIDFLFIDGDHSYRGVRSDFERYAPLVRRGGMVAFHDILPHPREARCEVERFWREIAGDYRTLEIAHRPQKRWGGIGVLFVGEDAGDRTI